MDGVVALRASPRAPGRAAAGITLVIAAVAGTGAARAQDLGGPAAAVRTTSTSSTPAAPVLVPPRPVGPAVIVPPAAVTTTVSVTVRLRLDEAGEVVRAELVRGAGAPFDAAVLEGALAFRFTPATYGGLPVPIELSFTQRFVPPPLTPVGPARGSAELPPVSPPACARCGVLVGRVEERGTRAPVASALVLAGATSTTTDGRGRFVLALPAGPTELELYAPGYLRFRQAEVVVEGEQVVVSYLLERTGPNPYEVTVVGQRQRREVSRTRLVGKDLTQIPGTFGDPFRVIGALPGAAPVNSLLPFPVVRGSSPGNTGFLVDGIRVPLLFHLLAGPSVLHPMFIDELEFSPGAFPVEYGGYTGGIVDGKTRAARPGEVAAELDLNFFQVGGLVRHPLPLVEGWTGTAAGRLGYPGLIIGLATPRVSLDYWDYQLRLDHGDATSGLSIFAFGARDALDTIPDGQPDTAALEPTLRFAFHRVDVSYHHSAARVRGQYQVTVGYDESLSAESASLSSWAVSPRARWSADVAPTLTLSLGLDAQARWADLVSLTEDLGAIGELLGLDGTPSEWLLSGGLLAEAIWRPTPDWMIRPGVRVDGYSDLDNEQVGVDPRLLARYQVREGLWLEGGLGLYHQPPRFTIPIPGLDQVAFDRGLLESVQATLGAELELGHSWSLDVATYFNWMDPIFYDVQLNESTSSVQNPGPAAPPGQAPPTPPRDDTGLGDRLDTLLSAATGRAYGLELLLRRESQTGVSGWLAYTLSRAERLRDDGWVGFDFDRTHILNLVVSVPLPRRWQVGLRVQAQSGRPVTTSYGLATGRTEPFVRFDLRIDKTAVWNDWLLDFYVDISNVVLAADEVAPQQLVRYVLPTLGFRARL